MTTNTPLWDDPQPLAWMDKYIRPAARQGDPSTSHAAASSVRNVTRTHHRILDLLVTWGPMPDEQIAHAYTLQHPREPISPSGLRSRRSELARAGMVEDTGQRVRTSAGRGSIVWSITGAGNTARVEQAHL